MKKKYSHLNEETNKFMQEIENLSKKEAIERTKDWINKTHFVYHEKARLTIDYLTEIFDEVESNQRDDGSAEFCSSTAVVGPTGSGKTETAMEFLRHHPEWHDTTNGHVPVARAILQSNITGLTGLYYSLLRALGVPISLRTPSRIADLDHQLLWALKAGGVRMFIVDEFQHLLGKNQRALVDQLKTILQVSRIAFIPMGTPPMRQVLELDTQLSDRCSIEPYTSFHNWVCDGHFKGFIDAYEQFLPLEEPSILRTSSIAMKIFERCQRLEYIPTGELLTNKQFEEWVQENKKKIIKCAPNGIRDWNKLVFNNGLYEKALYNEQLRNILDPEKQLTISTNLRRVTRYIRKLARRAIMRDMKNITEELINEFPI